MIIPDKLFKKTFLIFAGVLLALALLELAMQTAGIIIKVSQNYKNNIASDGKTRYTVMCLGESTTAGQYPKQLQQILNAGSPGEFSVIDCGIGGTDLDTILKLCGDNINRYKPDIAVCMMGINDKNHFLVSNKKKRSNFLGKTKIYGLYNLLKEHIKSSMVLDFYEGVPGPGNNSELSLQKAVDFFKQKDYFKAESILKQILKDEPRNELAYFCLFFIYSYCLTDYENTAYDMAVKGLNDGFGCGREDYYNIVIKYNLKRGNAQAAKLSANRAADDETLRMPLLLYRNIVGLIDGGQKDKLLKRILSQKTDTAYGAMAIENLERKNYEKAEEYFGLADKLRLNSSDEKTDNSYKSIIKLLTGRNIKVICMQYPVRSIEPLKNMLKNEEYYDKITFVSNEKNFKRALKEKEYGKIFNDQFAGDFGHCTDMGNSMIAENTAFYIKQLTNRQMQRAEK